MLLANNWTTGPKGAWRMHFIEQFSEHKPCFNPQVIHDNNLQQVLDEDGEEHNFSVFLSHIKETNIW